MNDADRQALLDRYAGELGGTIERLFQEAAARPDGREILGVLAATLIAGAERVLLKMGGDGGRARELVARAFENAAARVRGRKIDA